MVFLSSPQKMTELFLHRVNPIYYSDYSDTLFTLHGRKRCFLSWNIICAFSFAFLASNLEACWAKKDSSPKWQFIGVWVVSGTFYKGLNFNHFPCHTATKYLESGCMKHIRSEDTNHPSSIMEVISSVSITVTDHHLMFTVMNSWL